VLGARERVKSSTVAGVARLAIFSALRSYMPERSVPLYSVRTGMGSAVTVGMTDRRRVRGGGGGRRLDESEEEEEEDEEDEEEEE
jgi:hypothetical protein